MAIETAADSLHGLNPAPMNSEELREQICSTLQEALPDLKHAVRQYMTREAVHDEDAAEKLSQSEF